MRPAGGLFELEALPSARFSESSEVPASSDPLAPSFMPFLNSLVDLPTERASSGSFFAPKIRTTITRTTIHSGPGL